MSEDSTNPADEVPEDSPETTPVENVAEGGAPGPVDEAAPAAPPDEAQPPEEPAPPRRRHGCLWRLGCLSLLVLLFVAAAGAGVWALEAWARQPFGAPRTQPFALKAGRGARAAASQLHRAGLVSDDRLLLAWLALHGRVGQIQAGDYLIRTPITPASLIDILAHGRFERALTIPEGWTARQIARRLVREGWIANEREWLDLVARPVEPALLGEGSPLGAEGFCFPETYHLTPGTRPEAILRRMLECFRTEWTAAGPLDRDERARPLTQREIVTLASLIEREARNEAEMPQIAGVYYNRLARGMKLQCDATVHYALGEVWDRPLTLADLKIDSVYNTYRYAGLPPGPIANPGHPALAAALRPAPTDALFYVYSGEGYHIFSRTAAEHDKAIRELRRKRTVRLSASGGGPVVTTATEPTTHSAPAARSGRHSGAGAGQSASASSPRRRRS